MPSLPLHPAFVHVPLGLALVLPLVAAGVALAVWRGGLPRAAFAVVVGLQALLVASGVVSMQLGERDEERVERVVSERLIEVHEERAEVFVWAAAGVLVIAAAVLVVPRAASPVLAGVLCAASIGVAALAMWTGEAGGELVYHHGAAAAFTRATAGATLPAAHVSDDD